MEQNKKNVSHHHILPNKTAFMVFGALLVLTVITVAIAKVDLGPANFLIAMVVASAKAMLVALIFMNLKYDRKENAVIFVTSFLFLAIFVSFTMTDLFFRGDVYVKGPFFTASTGASKFKKAWISTPELVTHGKELFQAQCISCHGPNGMGDGPAAVALNPKPRNFHSEEGWKNGRRPSGVFKTLKDGIPGSGMASFATLPADDRWALAHYVLSLGGQVPADSTADLAKIGVDPTKEDGGASTAQEVTIPVEFALRRMMVAELPVKNEHSGQYPGFLGRGPGSGGAGLYEAQCLRCHGQKGEGGIKIEALGINPRVYLVSPPLAGTESLKNQDAFNRIVTRGLPGRLMPGYGQLSSAELHDLYQHVVTISR